MDLGLARSALASTRTGARLVVAAEGGDTLDGSPLRRLTVPGGFLEYLLDARDGHFHHL